MKTRNSQRQCQREDLSVTCQENVSMSDFPLNSSAQTPRKKRGPISKKHKCVRLQFKYRPQQIQKNTNPLNNLSAMKTKIQIFPRNTNQSYKNINQIMIENLMMNKLNTPLTTYTKTYYNVLKEKRIELYKFYNAQKTTSNKKEFTPKTLSIQEILSSTKNYLKRNIATETKPALKPIDMEETRKEEISKFRSISLYNKKQVRMPSSAEKCRSNEKIKVFNIFNNTPRNVRPSRSQQMLNGFKEKVVYSSHCRQSSATKPPISSRIDESLEQFQKATKPNMIPLRRFFKDNQVQQQQNIKLELEKHTNNNILDLLLLTTGELKKKFEDEHKQRDSNSRQNSEERVRIKVRNSHKFPKDFFL